MYKPQDTSLASAETSRAALGQQVSEDLARALAQFKDPQAGLRQLSRKMGIHSKTLKRLLHCAHKPGYITLYKIYRVTTGAANDTELLTLVPELVREHLLRGNPKRPESGVIFRGDLEKELLRDPIFAEIYFAAGAGDLAREEIETQYGQYGLQTLRKLVSLGVLKETTPYRYALGDCRINLTSLGIKHAASRLIETFAAPDKTDERDENHMAVYADGLTKEAYIEWLKIDQEAFRKKIELARDPVHQGGIRAFTVHFTDQFRFEKDA